jgi:hypothetical protein
VKVEALWPALNALGDDLILLSPSNRKGLISTPTDLGYGLVSAELVRLIAGGHVDIVKGRIARLDGPPPEDADLAAVLENMFDDGVFDDPKVGHWIGNNRKGIEDAYKRRMEAKGLLRSEARKWLKLFSTTDWFVTDEQRCDEVRQRLDEIIAGSEAIGIDDFALVGLVYAVELGDTLYPGRAEKERRKRLEQIATAAAPGPIWRRGRKTGASMSTAAATSEDPERATAVEATVNAAIAAAKAARARRNSAGSGV